MANWQRAWAYVQAAAVDASHRELAQTWCLGSPQQGMRYQNGGSLTGQALRSDSGGVHRWEKPSAGRVKVNVDGAVKANRAAGGGGLVRDSQGQWVVGFCHNMGTSNPLRAELQAMASAVQLVIDHSFPRVVVESDCAEAVRLVSCRVGPEHPHYGVLEQIAHGV